MTLTIILKRVSTRHRNSKLLPGGRTKVGKCDDLLSCLRCSFETLSVYFYTSNLSVVLSHSSCVIVTVSRKPAEQVDVLSIVLLASLCVYIASSCSIMKPLLLKRSQESSETNKKKTVFHKAHEAFQSQYRISVRRFYLYANFV